MKIYTQYNSYGYENFDENRKFSCHSWLFKCIENINDTFNIIEQNKQYIHEKDLVGKYNSLNFLLEIFTFHQTSGFKKYPKDRNIELDFCIILYGLLTHGAQIDSIDYERKTFLDNFDNIFQSQEDLFWKQKYKIFSKETIELIYNPCNREEILKLMLENEQRPEYLGLCLKLSLDKNTETKRKFKL